MPIPTDCVANGPNLRRDTGPLPTFISLPSRPPSACLSTLCWRANLLDDHNTNFTTAEINSHIVRAALPELHFKRVDAAAEADDGDIEEQCDVGPSVPTIMSVPLEGLAAPAERKFLHHAVLTVKNGRPTWEVESKRARPRPPSFASALAAAQAMHPDRCRR